jgi:hypothetical protein
MPHVTILDNPLIDSLILYLYIGVTVCQLEQKWTELEMLLKAQPKRPPTTNFGQV